MIRYVVLGLCISVALAACSLRMKRPELIERTVPQKAEEVLERDTHPSVTFSRRMERESVNRALSVSERRGELAGEWSWDGRTVEFSSYDRYEESTPYRLELSGTVRDARGAALRLSHSIPFFVSRGKRERVEILRMNPEDGSSLSSPFSPITLEFNTSMVPESLEHAVRVFPEAGVRISLDDSGKTCSIEPSPPGWLSGEIYRLSIYTSAVSTEGEHLRAASQAVYYADAAIQVLPPPAVSTVRIEPPPPFPEVSSSLEELHEGESFRLSFSRPVDKESIEFAFRISPFWAGSLYWIDSSACVFLPEPGESCTPGGTYRIHIDETARARDGGGMTEPFTAEFRAVERPKPSTLDGLPEDGFPLSLPHEPPIRISPAGTLGSYTLSWGFDAPVASVEERKRLQEALRILPLFPPDIGYPEVVHLLWPDARTLVCQVEGLGAGARGRRCFYSVKIPPETEVVLECGDE